MIPVPSGVRVWLAGGRTDMMRGMNGQALQVQEVLRRNPVFAQKSIRSQGAVIRDRTVGYARKFVQNPVTAIVKKIESRDLDRRPGYRLPYATGGRGRILPKRRDI